jgi:hypothetical protein
MTRSVLVVMLSVIILSVGMMSVVAPVIEVILKQVGLGQGRRNAQVVEPLTPGILAKAGPVGHRLKVLSDGTTTLIITKLSIMTLSIMTKSIMTLGKRI